MPASEYLQATDLPLSADDRAFMKGCALCGQKNVRIECVKHTAQYLLVCETKGCGMIVQGRALLDGRDSAAHDHGRADVLRRWNRRPGDRR